LLCVFRDVAAQEAAVTQMEQQERQIRQRVQGLACLAEASRLMADAEAPLPAVLQAIVDSLPAAMNYPDHACARIAVSGNELTTAGFKQTNWGLLADIALDGKPLGTIEVFYLTEMPQADEGPFHKYERDFLDTLARDIAGFVQRKRNRDALVAHERRLQLILSANPDYTYLTDAEGKVLYANKASLDLIGVTLDQARRINIFSHFTTTDPVALSLVATRLQAGGEVRGFEVTLILDGRKPLDLEIHATPIKNAGRVVEILSVARDITARKRAEELLRHQLELLRILMDTIPSPVYYKDTAGCYTGCNPAFARLLGLTQQEIIGKTVHEIAPKEMADEYFKKDSELFASPGTQTFQWQIRTAQGDVRDVVCSRATFARPSGTLAGLVGVVLDITDLVRTEAALTESEAAYKCLFEEAPIALLELDVTAAVANIKDLLSRGVIDLEAHFTKHPDDLSALVRRMVVTRVNSAALSLIGCATTDEFPEALVRSIYPHAKAMVPRALAKLAGGGTRFQAEHTIHMAQDRDRHVSMSIAAIPAFVEQAVHVLVSAIDITHLKETEDVLRRAELQLQTYSRELEKMVEQRTRRIHELERQRAASEKIAATGRMAARIAHEINNPLAGIKNSFLLIRKAVPEDHPRFEYVELIEREIGRIALIIRKMFELYRDEPSARHSVSLVESIREVLALLESSLREKEIRLLVDAPQAPVRARLPVGYLSQVMFNLLRNAIEASPTAGTITVSVEPEASGPVIKIKDEGHGIAPEHRDLIFEPFFTTRSEGDLHGLGLGLSVSKSMTEAMGGTITFETNVGKGTTFVVRFPLETEVGDV
jgi:PAS domain S-box-containing protein